MPIKSDYRSIPISDEPIHIALMRALWHTSLEKPTTPILIDVETGDEVTAKQLYMCAQSVATFLEQRHFARGDIACVVLPNCWQYAPFFLGCAIAGGAVSGASFLFTDYELEQQFSDSKCKVVLTSSSNLDRVLTAARKCPLITTVIVIGGNDLPWGLVSWNDVVKTEPNSNRQPIGLNMNVDLVMLPYSSGTTGPPKGVMMTHRNLRAMHDIFNNHMNAILLPKLDPDWKWKNEAMVLFLPFCHIYGFHLLLNILREGATGVVLAHFDLKRFCAAIERYKIRFVFLVPPILVLLAKSPIVEQFDLSSLRFFISGSAPAGKDLIDEVHRRLPKLAWMSQAYGMSEMSLASFFSVAESSKKIKSTGKLMTNFEAQIVEATSGRECDRNVEGELWIRSPTVMLGYLNRPQATADALTVDGWLRTGDLAYVDDEGHLYITERLKELIKVKGHQVPPAELEDLLLSHPSVQDAAVVGIPDDLAGELPRAYVVKKPGIEADKLTSADLQSFVSAKVAHFKHLKAGVEFITEIPKSPTGKILRRFLRQKAAQERQSKL